MKHPRFDVFRVVFVALELMEWNSALTSWKRQNILCRYARVLFQQRS